MRRARVAAGAPGRLLRVPGIVVLFVAVLGACIGSFLNVVGMRTAKGESSVGGRSHCPKCSSVIRWYDNIPILSWILLRGRCRRCREAISVRYPLGETIGALLFTVVAVSVSTLPPLLIGLITVVAVITVGQLALGQRHDDTYASRRE